MSKNRLMIAGLVIFFTMSSTGYAIRSEKDIACAGVIPVELNSSLHMAGDDSDFQWFRVEAPSSGILALDLAISYPGGVDPVLGLAEGNCGRSFKHEAHLLSLKRSPANWMLAVQAPGTYLFQVAPEDRRRKLDEYRLRADFVPVPLPDSPFDIPEKEDPNIIEIDPETILWTPLAGHSSEVLSELCRPVGRDDHGDTFPCATRLHPGVTAEGEIANDKGDDVDVFAFVLDRSHELWTVELTSGGGSDTFGTLYDRFGQRLEQGSDIDEENDFRIVRTLPPGGYFVRVESRYHSQGRYELNLTATSR